MNLKHVECAPVLEHYPNRARAHFSPKVEFVWLVYSERWTWEQNAWSVFATRVLAWISNTMLRPSCQVIVNKNKKLIVFEMDMFFQHPEKDKWSNSSLMEIKLGQIEGEVSRALEV